MKKTIVAVAVMGLMTTVGANAANVYNQNGTSVDVFGTVKVKYKSGFDIDGESSPVTPHSTFAGSGTLGVNASFKLNDQIDAILASEWDTNTDKNDTNSGFSGKNIYIGFDAHQYGKLTIGQNDNAFYTGLTAMTDKLNEYGAAAGFAGGREAGIITYDLAYQGLAVHLSGGAHSAKLNSGTSSDMSYDTEGMTNWINYTLGTKKIVSTDPKDQYDLPERTNTYTIALDYTFDFSQAGALQLAGAYQSKQFSDENRNLTNWGLGLAYSWKGLYFGGIYNQNKTHGIGDRTFKAKGYEVVLTYQLNEQWKLLSGYSKMTADDDSAASIEKDFIDQAAFGVQYNLTPDLKTYVEYKIAGKVTTGVADGTMDPDNQWAIAMEYKF